MLRKTTQSLSSKLSGGQVALPGKPGALDSRQGMSVQRMAALSFGFPPACSTGQSHGHPHRV